MYIYIYIERRIYIYTSGGKEGWAGHASWIAVKTICNSSPLATMKEGSTFTNATAYGGQTNGHYSTSTICPPSRSPTTRRTPTYGGRPRLCAMWNTCPGPQRTCRRLCPSTYSPPKDPEASIISVRFPNLCLHIFFFFIPVIFTRKPVTYLCVNTCLTNVSNGYFHPTTAMCCCLFFIGKQNLIRITLFLI